MNIRKFVIIIVIALVIIAGGLSYRWFAGRRGQSAAPQPKTAEQIERETQQAAKEVRLQRAEESWNKAIQTISALDKDFDGLSDADEAKYGTNPDSADTDGDGLLDKTEIDIYKTDPLKPDTDGDGFKDGEEARGGYNPKGKGRL